MKIIKKFFKKEEVIFTKRELEDLFNKIEDRLELEVKGGYTVKDNLSKKELAQLKKDIKNMDKHIEEMLGFKIKDKTGVKITIESPIYFEEKIKQMENFVKKILEKYEKNKIFWFCPFCTEKINIKDCPMDSQKIMIRKLITNKLEGDEVGFRAEEKEERLKNNKSGVIIDEYNAEEDFPKNLFIGIDIEKNEGDLGKALINYMEFRLPDCSYCEKGYFDLEEKNNKMIHLKMGFKNVKYERSEDPYELEKDELINYYF
jgi:hypothetical protein